MFRSHREKSRSVSTSYDRKSGLLSRVRRIITPTWTNTDGATKKLTERAGLPEKSSSIRRFAFPETSLRSDAGENESLMNDSSVATATNIPLLSDDVNPSEVLSRFFQQKGDVPLTQVEYEGVMSLLQKSKTGGASANNSVIMGGSAASNRTQPEIRPIDRPVDRANLTTSNIQMPGSFSAATPYTQKSLRNTSMRERSMYVSTPEYKPQYKSINNTVNIPSIKRVYQFSGLPSPYKTKIKPPPPLSANSSMNSTILPRSIAGSNAVASSTARNSPVPSSKRPLSETANVLLSILDGKQPRSEFSETGLESERENRLKLLSNPYGRGSGLKRSKQSQKVEPSPALIAASKAPAVFTADDITKTIAYDRTQDLPLTKKPIEDSSVSKPAELAPAAKSFEEAVPSTVEVKNDKPAFANGTLAPRPAPEQPTNIASGLSQPASSTDEKVSDYVFPQIKSLTVQIDEGKVEEYKSLFNFDV